MLFSALSVLDRFVGVFSLPVEEEVAVESPGSMVDEAERSGRISFNMDGWMAELRVAMSPSGWSLM